MNKKHTSLSRHLISGITLAVILMLVGALVPRIARAESADATSAETFLEYDKPPCTSTDDGDSADYIVPLSEEEADALSTQAVAHRTSAPEAGNKWYYSDLNPYYRYRSWCLAPCGTKYGGVYVTGNCTWYAWGRAAEVMGESPDIGQCDPVRNWNYVKDEHKYQTSSVPRAHSIAIYEGHAAYVEEVLSDGSFIVSESHYTEMSYWPGYENVAFTYGTSISQGYRTLYGFIYLPYPEGYNEPEEPGCFPDVAKSYWANDIIQRSVDLGIFTGYSNGNFGPMDNLTRGQVAVALWNLAGKPSKTSGAKSFSDVQKNKYYYYAVRWASAAGVVHGYDDGLFKPEESITREDLAVMIWNYACNVEGLDATGSISNFSSMKDKWSVSSYARKAVGWCFKNGILSGSGGYVYPQSYATRAEAAKMLVKAHDVFA